MLYAVIMICAATLGMCDMDNSLFVHQTLPMFRDVAACQAGALDYLHMTNFDDILQEGKDYMININCMLSSI